MKHLRRAWKRLVGLLAGSHREAELASEIETHLLMQTEDNLRLGMSSTEARRQAVLRFGSVESMKEAYREQRGLPRLESVGRDIRVALRAMRRNPGFTAAVISSLGLGIAATVAIFTVADAVLPWRWRTRSARAAVASTSRCSRGCAQAVTAAQAQAELDAIDRRVRPNRREGVTVRALDDAVTARVRPPLLILFGAVTMALLIACLNVASLLLARGLRRQAEVALRIALGATGGRVVRQLLTEALMLALAAAAISLPLAWAAVQGMVWLAPNGIPRLDTVALDGRVLAFTLAVSVACALAFGTVPALIAARRQPSDVLKEGVNRSTAARSVALRLLVVGESGPPPFRLRRRRNAGIIPMAKQEETACEARRTCGRGRSR